MSVLKPTLSLLRHDDGSFSLYSTMIAPDAGYFAARAAVRMPDDAWVSEDSLAVTLPLVTSNAPSLRVAVPVVHELANLTIAPDKKRLVAFVCVNGRLIDVVETAISTAQRVTGTTEAGKHLTSSAPARAVGDSAPGTEGERGDSRASDGDGCWGIRPPEPVEGAFWGLLPYQPSVSTNRTSPRAEGEGPFPLRFTSSTDGDGEHDGPFPLRFASTRVHLEDGDRRLRMLGRIVLALSRFYHGNGTASYLVVEDRPNRSRVPCEVCGEPWNTGFLTLQNVRTQTGISIPYLTAHELAHHGTNRTTFDCELLASIVNERERELGSQVHACLVGTALPPNGVTLAQHRLRGLDWCIACDESVNLGSFTLQREGTEQGLTLPYLAVHALLAHGDPVYDGRIHHGRTPIETLTAILAKEPG